MHIFHGEYEARYTLIPGHEFSGTVVAVGEGVARYRVGDRVRIHVWTLWRYKQTLDSSIWRIQRAFVFR